MKTVPDLWVEISLAVSLFFVTFFFGGVYAWVFLSVAAFLYLLIVLKPNILSPFFGLPKFSQAAFLLAGAGLLVQIFLTSIDRNLTLEESLKNLAFFCAFLSVLALPLSSIERLMAFLAVLGALQALYALAETLTRHEHILWQPKEFYQGFATGTFFNRNHLAGFLELVLGVQGGLFCRALGRKKNSQIIFWALCWGVTFFAFLKTGSRMGMISFAMSFLGLYFLAGRKIFHQRWIISVILIAVAAMAMIGGKALWLRWTDIETLGTSTAGRWDIWPTALTMAKDYFWTGSGLGTFEWVFPAYQPAHILRGYSHAHQDYLELMATLGVPLFLCLVSGFVILIWNVIKKSASLKSETFRLVWGLGIGFIAFLLHGLADFNFAIPANHLFFLLILGLSVKITTPSPDPSPPRGGEGSVSKHRVRGKLCRFAGAGFFLLCAVQIGPSFHFYKAERAFQGKDYSHAIEEIRKVSRNSRRLYLEGQSLLQTHQYEAASQVFEQLTQQSPRFGRGWLYLALAHQEIQTSEWESIKGWLFKAQALEPGSAWVHYQIAKVFILHKELLSPQEKEWALQQMTFALQLHDSNQASGYLSEALEMLWKQYKDFEILMQVVPHDFYSYDKLLRFAEKKRLFIKAEQMRSETEQMRREQYDKQCQKAKDLLARGDYGRAYQEYQICSWIDNQRNEAEAGMQEAQKRKG